MKKSKGREHWPSRRPWMKIVKHFSTRKDRQMTRELLSHKNYDDIPQNNRTKVEDPWGWD